MFCHLVLAAVSLAAAPSNTSASRPTTALVTLLNVPESVARDLRTAAARSVQLMGGDVVPHAYLRGAANDCKNDRACWVGKAAQANATHVLFYSGTIEDTSFELITELWSTTTADVDGPRVEKECGICSLKDLHKAAEDAATQLLGRVRAAPQVTAMVPPAPGPMAPASAPPVYEQPLPMLGAALAAFGVVAVIAAVSMQMQDGDLVCQPTDPTCVIRRKEAGNAPLLWGILGAASVIGGGTLFYFSRQTGEAGGAEVGVAGRF